MGVAGRMHVNQYGDTPRPNGIDQQQGEKRVTVGFHQPDSDQGDGEIFWLNGGIRWRGGRPPQDATFVHYRQKYLSKELYVTMCTLAAFGMCVTIFFFIFNVAFRARRIIKMSSPNINNIILVGCWLEYSTVFIQETPGGLLGAQEGTLCVVRQFTFVTGFSLAFGALFSKTWRIHRILTMSSKNKKVVIRDFQLLVVILALVLVDIFVLVTWYAVDPMQVEIRDLDGQVSDVEADSMIIPQLHVCVCDNEMYFTGTLYLIQGLMLAFGAFLAWETRKVKVEALNDSKQIGMCIYNVLTLSILGVAVSRLVDNDLDVSYGFMSAVIIVGTTVTQGIIFVPKIFKIRIEETTVMSVTL